MAVHPQAGQRADAADLCNIPALVTRFFQAQPTPGNPALAYSPDLLAQ